MMLMKESPTPILDRKESGRMSPSVTIVDSATLNFENSLKSGSIARTKQRLPVPGGLET